MAPDIVLSVVGGPGQAPRRRDGGESVVGLADYFSKSSGLSPRFGHTNPLRPAIFDGGPGPKCRGDRAPGFFFDRHGGPPLSPPVDGADVTPERDVNGDGKIGLEEAVYVLRNIGY